jgi:hypothetical protein
MNATRPERWRQAVLAGVVVVVVSACSSAPGSAVTGSAVTGSGTLRTESREVAAFSVIELTGSGDVVVEQDGTESLVIEAEDNLLPELTTDVSSGVLRLGTREGVDLSPTLPITYRITVDDLAGVQLSGSGSVTAAGITTPGLASDLSGSGDITIDGSATSQTVTVSGSGDYRAGELVTHSSTAAISGSGSIAVQVLDVLDVGISGSGDVTYTGDPRVTQDISGSGELRNSG